MTAIRRGARWSLALLVFAACGTPAPLGATEPAIRNLSVRGLQVGGTTTLVVDGEALGTAPRLMLPFPAKQTLKPGTTATRATFDVTLGGDVPPGYYHLRTVTPGGVSLPIAIGVDRLPQRPLGAAVEPLPVALHGAVSGSTTAEAKFAGKAGQKVLVEVESVRLGSKLRPVVHLTSPKRLQVAWSWPTPTLSGDTRLEATLPEDGPYTVSVHDAEYAGASPGFFRLKIGQWSFVDQVFPPVVGKGKQSVELLGPSPAPRIALSITGDTAVLPLAWPKEGNWSGPRPFVVVGSHAEVLGQPPGGKPQELPAGPVGVSGRLVKPFEEHRYRISVKPGSKLRLEVFAERYGSPLDASLVVRNEAGAVLAQAEDGPGTLDPALDYNVPDKVTALVVGVVDAQGRAGPRGVYRLTVEPKESAAGKGDFRLLTPTERVGLSVGGRSVVPVWIERRGYHGSVNLSAAGLPAGVNLENATIPAGADGTLVTVQRGEPAGEAAVSTWRGRGDNGLEQTVSVKGHPLKQIQPWLATELAVAPTTDKAADFQIDWRGLAADAGIVPARKLVLPVKVTRPATTFPVRLTLLTSQLPPFVNGQPDLNRTLRLEKPVELAAKVADGDPTVLVPPELPSPVYDVTVRAELLAADRRTVLATAFAPVRRLAVRLPLVVQLDGPARVEAKVNPKDAITIEIKGKIERREGLTGDVAVTLTGLPPGVQAGAVTVKAGVTAFAVKVVLPPNLAAGEFKGLKLAGTAALDPKQPNVRVRSREVELTLVVRPAG